MLSIADGIYRHSILLLVFFFLLGYLANASRLSIFNPKSLWDTRLESVFILPVILVPHWEIVSHMYKSKRIVRKKWCWQTWRILYFNICFLWIICTSEWIKC